ncbi:MAG: endo-1,4-beta-xylanase [Spirochaetales bacterium]|nr:endo-1,4-beta-xylanase [Spirochaetales bacterium]
MKKRVRCRLIMTIAAFTMFVSCPAGDPGTPDDLSKASTLFTFETDTAIGEWLSENAVYNHGENGATGGTLSVSTERARHGNRSLEVAGMLGDETYEYTSHQAIFNLDETTGTSPLDASRTMISVSVYVPSAPEGGGDYIQVVLYNGSDANIQSRGFSCPEGSWNDIVFDIGLYADGTESWGYDGTGGNPESVYGAVTRIGVKVGFTTGPDRTYRYFIDDLYWAEDSLRSLCHGAGLYIGAAVNPLLFDETGYTNSLRLGFNAMVAENVMKMTTLQPLEGTFNFVPADAVIDYAVKNAMEVRGHTLLWHNQVPSWVSVKSYSQLEDVLQHHIDTVTARYRGKIGWWDVANEVIRDDGSGLRNNDDGSSIWADSPADDSLIKQAFLLAHASDPDALLYINDYNNEAKGSTKADALYDLIEAWVNIDSIPIHGVGFQLHLMEKYTPDYTAIRSNIDRYIALGLEVQFTEIDVRIEEPVTPAKLDHQAEIYASVMRIALDYPEVTAFMTWGVTDKYSWIPSFFEGYDEGLLFDRSYGPKPAYEALIEILR